VCLIRIPTLVVKGPITTLVSLLSEAILSLALSFRGLKNPKESFSAIVQFRVDFYFRR